MSAASACRAARRPASTSTKIEHRAADDEEAQHREDRVAALAGGVDHRREHQRAEDAGIALEHAEEGEELRRLVPRDHAGEERSAERLRAALHHADQDRQREELRRGGHVVAERDDEGVDRQAGEHGRLRADPPGDHSEQERERHADELRDEQRRDHRVLVDADLAAEGRRHPDDGLDAVVVEEERDQQQERLPVAPQLVERFDQPADADAKKAAGRRFVRPRSRRAGSGTWRKSGIENTSHQMPTLASDSLTAVPRVRRCRTTPAAGSSAG